MPKKVGDECLDCGHHHLFRIGAQYIRTNECHAVHRGEDGELHFSCRCPGYQAPPLIAALSKPDGTPAAWARG